MLESALESLRRGEFVLLFDSAGRENEIDMVVAAEFITPEHISRMRRHAGGLVCTALEHSFAESLHLRYMHEMLADSEHRDMVLGLAPYGDRPSFSISVNHHSTYTGITDRDRALTIQKIASIYGMSERRKEFVSSFRTPGHVPLLVAADGLLAERRGHTEMSVYLARLAGLVPVTVVCEMLDAQTYAALTVKEAQKFAKQHAIPLVDGEELLGYAKVHLS
ncbi:MAG: 3,4-dihydroxy-2-butanone-4-phosphate synthase [Nitrosopumilus sp. B06]|nr:MAG: 3,4-dihydroxy-2-butanone-4-phosphate synthase [Nitrosopumilus sp. D6]RNJ79656.1 MAG: 3,4-dihydroxy-2-butanone-4-phosphate synthase [Nitrosopumilus sp. B06]